MPLPADRARSPDATGLIAAGEIVDINERRRGDGPRRDVA
jgi:hypothetical protein